MINRAFAALGRGVVRHRYLVVAAWLAAVVAASLTLPSLGSQVNNDNSQFLPANAPSNVAANLAAPLLGDQTHHSQMEVVATSASRTLSPGAIGAIRAELAAVRVLPKVTTARVGGVSARAGAAEIFVDARISPSNIDQQKALVRAIEATFPPAGRAGLTYHVAGAVATNVANQAKSTSTGNEVQIFSILFIVVLLFVIFRSFLAPLITLLPAALALVLANRLIGALGHGGLRISEITQLLLIVLMLGAGTDYGLFLVFRAREELCDGRDGKDAVAHALSRVGESITASGATVIFALLSLLLASFGVYHDLGIPLAIGIAVILLSGVTLLPALLAIAGRAAFFPGRIGPGAHRGGWWGAVASRMLRRPALALLVGVAAFGGLAAAALGYHAGGFGGAVDAPRGTDAAIGNAVLARDFPVASTNPTNLIFHFDRPIYGNPSVLSSGAADLRASGLFTKVLSGLDVTGAALSPATFRALHGSLGPASDLPTLEPASDATVPVAAYNAYRASALFVSRDGRTVQYEVGLRAGDASSNAAIRSMPAVRAVVARVGARLGASATGVAGQAPALYDVASTSNADLLHIVPIAILAIGLLLAIVLRSLVAPLYLIVSVGLSYLASLGVAVIFFIDLSPSSTGLSFVLPFLMFIFLLALGEDYNILVMTRIREEAHDLPLRDAVIHAVGRTGQTITSAGLVLAGTFAVLAFSARGGPGGSEVESIGIGLAVGVLLDTFVVRTLLVPAMVTLLGRFNWWPSRLSKQAEVAPLEAEVPLPVG